MIFLKPEQYLKEAEGIFETLKKQLDEKIPSAEVEHIGSSSIVGALSKGDLDILLRVQEEGFEEALELVQSLGFRIKEGTLRTNSLCMLEIGVYKIEVAIQVIVANSEFENFVRFRNILNAQPQLVEKYNALKLESEGCTHREYRERKSKFIASVLEKEVR